VCEKRVRSVSEACQLRVGSVSEACQLRVGSVSEACRKRVVGSYSYLLQLLLQLWTNRAGDSVLQDSVAKLLLQLTWS